MRIGDHRIQVMKIYCQKHSDFLHLCCHRSRFKGLYPLYLPCRHDMCRYSVQLGTSTLGHAVCQVTFSDYSSHIKSPSAATATITQTFHFCPKSHRDHPPPMSSNNRPPSSTLGLDAAACSNMCRLGLAHTEDYYAGQNHVPRACSAVLPSLQKQKQEGSSGPMEQRCKNSCGTRWRT